ncbi:MAG: acetate--CoA ligase family protein [Candidatus Burarchaeum sp.]|nr:acetate--CoA ligase family protein [Candidatus Burarchaeum sp.]MDO8339630.1 acetate--CoA ligase family protein [Candidatus Burarchaeum sp.]
MSLLSFEKTMALMGHYGIALPAHKLAKTPEEAARLAATLGYPVALKVASDKIIHKSDVGGVKLNLRDANEVKRAYDDIALAVGQANAHAILVQKMASAGVELIVGGKRDPQFGPVIVFGLGGIFVEIFKDVTLRVCPIDKDEAKKMLHEIKGYPLLAGARGTKPVDEEALAGLLVAVSKLLNEHDEIKELDLNPVIAYPHGYMAVDARIIV